MLPAVGRSHGQASEVGRGKGGGGGGGEGRGASLAGAGFPSCWRDPAAWLRRRKVS